MISITNAPVYKSVTSMDEIVKSVGIIIKFSSIPVTAVIEQIYPENYGSKLFLF